VDPSLARSEPEVGCRRQHPAAGESALHLPLHKGLGERAVEMAVELDFRDLPGDVEVSALIPSAASSSASAGRAGQEDAGTASLPPSNVSPPSAMTAGYAFLFSPTWDRYGS